MIRGKYTPIKNDDREEIVNSYENGATASEIASLYQFNVSTVRTIIKKYLQTGNYKTEYSAEREGIQKLNEEQKEQVRRWVDEDCSITLLKLAERILQEMEIKVSRQTISRVLKSFHYTLKPVHRIPDANAIEVQSNNELLFSGLRFHYNENSIVFVDEIGFNVSMRSIRARSLVGKPAVKNVPVLRSRNMSIICAMNRGGLIYYKLHKGPATITLFSQYFNELALKLADFQILERVIVMDNNAFHHTSLVKEAAEANNFTILYLPSYYPILNPIENLFSKLENIVKEINPSSETDLIQAIEDGVNMATSNFSKEYYTNMWSYISSFLNNEIIEN